MTITIAEPAVHDGVDATTLLADLDAVKAAPWSGWVQFRAGNEWIRGTHSRSTIHGYYGDGEERCHQRSFQLDADHPAVLAGGDNGPSPVEFALHALVACLTASLASAAAAKGIRLTEIRSTVCGDIDFSGVLGSGPAARGGRRHISVCFLVKGDAPAETLRQLAAQSQACSPLYDIITNRMPVTIEVETD